MNKRFAKVFAPVLAVIFIFSGCSGGNSAEERPTDTSSAQAQNSKKDGNELKEITIPNIATGELETFNFLHSQTAEDAQALLNLWDGLLTSNSRGELVPAIAEEWGTEDGGLTWTFHIRDGVKWVDVNGKEMADCNANDFATGMEWVLNFHKNESVNTSMPLEMIK